MNRQVLTYKIISNHAEFIQYINSLSEAEFMHAANGKWSAGQQLEHILRAVRPVSFAFSLPVILPRVIFGRSKRPGRSYHQLITRYKEKLQNGGRASGRFVPGPVPFHKRKKLTESLQATARKLSRLVSRMDEDDMDRVILPHPLLGKLTLREMLFFTIYHVEHHQSLTKKYLHADTLDKDDLSQPRYNHNNTHQTEQLVMELIGEK